MLAEVIGRAAPGELGGLAVVHSHALLVDEGVLGIIAIELQRLAGLLHGFLERIDCGRRAPIVLVREVPLERHPDLGRVESLGGMP